MRKKIICYAVILSLLAQSGGLTAWARPGKTAEPEAENIGAEESAEPVILNEIETFMLR